MTNSHPRDLAAVGAAAALGIGALSWLWYKRQHQEDCDRVEDGVEVGSSVIAKWKYAWIGSPYYYGKVVQRKPLQVRDSRGNVHFGKDLEWVMLAQDDGWLGPYGLEWQRPGRHILMQLLTKEWISAKVAADHKEQPIKAGPLHLKIEGIDDLTSVCIQTDVAFLFTAHEDCQEEFGHANPSRGGRLAEHIADAFEIEAQRPGETLEDAERRQRKRWVEVSRTDGQYPIRSVWVHPSVKEGALNEFCHRARSKKQECPEEITPEIVMLLGPPAAGKSSIGRLKPEQLTGSMKCLRKTASSLKYREEVNNDNLTDCMPGFAFEYKFALNIEEDSLRKHEPSSARRGSFAKKKSFHLWQKAKLGVKAQLGCVASRLQWIQQARKQELSAESWALQWLTYLVYHHGPVRDSLALDIIKVTIIDAAELPVYYSSCMAGKAMARSMMILDLAHSNTQPVPHEPLLFRGFWPYTSQESRFDRQAGRAADEKKEGKLKGGNLTSNLVDIHYHAQQAETNITRMLGCLKKGVKPSDDADEEQEETKVGVDHFLVIDNEGKEPVVLLDFACEDNSVDENIRNQLLGTIEEMVSHRQLFDKEWDELDPHLFQIAHYYLQDLAHEEHDLKVRGSALQQQRNVRLLAEDPEGILPLVTGLDEAIFFRKYGKRSTATDTDKYRWNEDIGPEAREVLARLHDDDVNRLKKHMSMLRKYTCLVILQCLKREGDYLDEMEDAEQQLSGN